MTIKQFPIEATKRYPRTVRSIRKLAVPLTPSKLKLSNEVGGMDTTEPENVHKDMKVLLKEYNGLKRPTLEDIIDFHQRFEAIHPFQDGNGRVGRLHVS